MWQLLFFAVAKAVEILFESGSSSGPERVYCPVRERTQQVSGYIRSDGVRVSSYRRRPPR